MSILMHTILSNILVQFVLILSLYKQWYIFTEEKDLFTLYIFLDCILKILSFISKNSKYKYD